MQLRWCQWIWPWTIAWGSAKKRRNSQESRSNWYSYVLLYIGNGNDFLQYWRKRIWSLPRWENFETCRSICPRYLRLPHAKTLFWAIIWRLVQAWWWDRERLLEISRGNTTHRSHKAIMAMVLARSFHRYCFDVPTRRMDSQKIPKDSIQSERRWQYYPFVASFIRHLAIPLLLSWHPKRFWNKIFVAIDTDFDVHHVRFLHLPTANSHWKRRQICNVDEGHWTMRINRIKLLENIRTKHVPPSLTHDGKLWRCVLQSRLLRPAIFQVNVEDEK